MAKVTLDDREIILNAGEYVDIPVGAAHRIENPGSEKVIFIEVQRGDYLGEDDIVRLQDDFGRCGLIPVPPRRRPPTTPL